MNFTVEPLGILNRSYLMIVLSMARMVVVFPLLEICAAPDRTWAFLMSFLPRAASALALHMAGTVIETAAAKARRPLRVVGRTFLSAFVCLEETRSIPREYTAIEASTASYD